MEFGTFSRLEITGLVRIVWVTHRSVEEKGDEIGFRKRNQKREKDRDSKISALYQECWRLAGDRPGKLNWI